MIKVFPQSFFSKVNNDITISVIIPVYNSQSFLHSTIKNLKDQSIKSKFEILY